MNWLAGGIGLLAGMVIGFNRANLPSAEFWLNLGFVVAGAIFIAAAVPPIQAFVAEHGERKKRRNAELATTLHDLLAGTLITLVDSACADWKKTGLHVFVVRRERFQQVQASVAKLRLAHIAPAGVKWTYGKGLIGKCWASGEPVSAHLDTHFAPYSGLDKRAWDKLPPTVEKYGLSYQEFKKIHAKFGLVVAFPLTKADKYVGCIVADMPPGSSKGVNEAKVQETLSSSAPSISAIVTKQ